MKKMLLLFFFIISFSSLKEDVKLANKYIKEANNLKLKEVFLKIISYSPKNDEEILLIDSSKFNLANIYINENNHKMAVKYLYELSSSTKSDKEIALLSNKKLIDLAIIDNDFIELEKQLESINEKTSYTEVLLISKLIYTYYKNNNINKIEILENRLKNELTKENIALIYYNLGHIFLEELDHEKSKIYFDKILGLNYEYAKDYAYLGYASIDLLNNKIYEANQKLEYILTNSKNINDKLLAELENRFLNIGNIERAYNVTLKRYNLDNKNIDLLINLIRETNFLKKDKELKQYLKELEKINLSNWEKALKLRGVDLVEYSEKYLIKAMEENDIRAINALLDIYFNTMNSKFLEVVEKTKFLNDIEKDKLKKQFFQFLEFNKKEKQ